MSHSPAPWTVEEAAGERGTVLYLTVQPAELQPFTYRGAVATVHHAEEIEGITWAEARANARLIAAAPQLLAALRLFVEESSPHTERERRTLARIAIAMAAPAEVLHYDDSAAFEFAARRGAQYDAEAA